LTYLSYRHFILHRRDKFRPNRTTQDRVVTSYRFFFKMVSDSYVGFCIGNIRPPRKCKCESQFDLQAGFTKLQLIGFIVLGILSLEILSFRLEIVYSHGGLCCACEESKSTSGVETTCIWIREDRFAYSASNFQNCFFSNKKCWCLLMNSSVLRNVRPC